MDDTLVPPAQPDIQLDIRAQVDGGSAAQARRVTIEVFYRTSTEQLVSLPSTPQQVDVAPGGSAEQPVAVKLEKCLRDPHRIDVETGGCHLVVRLTLLDDSGQELASETEDVESPVSPGQTVSVVPVTLLAVESVNIGIPPILSPGDTVTLVAQAFARDHILGGRTFAWSSDHPTVATMDASGLLTAVGPGAATITATTGGIGGTAAVTVELPPSRIVKLSGDGDTCPIDLAGACVFAVKVTNDLDKPVEGAAVVWRNVSTGTTFTEQTDDAGISTAHSQEATTTPGTFTQTATLVKSGQQVTFAYTLTHFFRVTIMGNPAGSGSGLVTADAATNTFTCIIGIAGVTSGTCAGDYPQGTTVTLTPAPDVGSVFGGWLGACVPCSGSNEVTVVVDSSVTKTATFDVPTF